MCGIEQLVAMHESDRANMESLMDPESTGQAQFPYCISQNVQVSPSAPIYAEWRPLVQVCKDDFAVYLLEKKANAHTIYERHILSMQLIISRLLQAARGSVKFDSFLRYLEKKVPTSMARLE